MAISLNDKFDSAERHRAVVEHGQGLLVVEAGPGTGKTYSLLRKIESLIVIGVDPTEIYYITFVNSIVDAFKDDIRKPTEDGGLGADPDDLGIHISTLHSLAFKIVKVYSTELGLPEHLEVIDLSPKPQSLLSQVFVGDLFAYAKARNLVSNKKSFDKLLKALTESWRLHRPIPTDCEFLADATDTLCNTYEVCPWDKLVLHAIRAVEENGLPTWLQGAQHFLIDEYQDFNPSEQRLIELITEPSDSIIIVGDPDQSIYSGRSASPEGILNLLERPDAWTVSFVYCRRCPRKVVEAANNLLRFMDEDGYPQRELQAFKDDDGDFNIQSFKSCKAEIEAIAEALQSMDESEYKNVILLLPKRNVAEYYARKLSEVGVTCTIKSADTSAELREAILRLIVLHDQPFICRILLSHFPNIERKFREQVLVDLAANGTSLIDALTRAAEDHRWQKRLKDTLTDFRSVHNALTSDDVQSITTALDSLKTKVSENLVICLLNSDPKDSVRNRVESCVDATSDEDEDEDSDDTTTAVQVMTMHGSKGLSKELVIIPAFDEKLLPGGNSGERLQEVHRLVYVAVTRVKSHLLVTFPKTRAKGDPLNYPPRPQLSSYAQILTGLSGTPGK